jgi:hypothetical protein
MLRMMGCQVMVMLVGSNALSAVALNGPEWGMPILLGSLSLPVGTVIRLMRNTFINPFIRSPKFSIRSLRRNCELGVRLQEDIRGN